MNQASKALNASGFIEAVLRSYSIIFFTESKWIGLTLLLTTFLAPVYGTFGLLGLLVALAAAYSLGFDEKTIRSGAFSFNSLLTCMALAYLSHFQWDLTWRDGFNLEPIHLLRMLVLVICFSLVAFFTTILLSNLLKVHLGLPSMSLPFVASSALAYFLFYSFTRTPIAAIEPDFLLPALPGLAPVLQTFLEAFGAIFFLPNVGIGLIILICLLVSSRLMVIYGAVAFIAGIGFLALFGYEITSANLAWIGFNFLFSGMVLGGVFFIPGRASIPIAMISAFFCAALAIAFRSLFWNFNIPPLALPFNLVVLTIVYSLNLRSKVNWLFANPFPDGTPERNFWKFHSTRNRFPDALEPSVYPPFSGERVVTQAFDGDITHVGDFRHAFDFEIVDEKGRKHSGPGDALADFYTFGSDVISPEDGVVVTVIDHVKDNPVGRNNLAENWGNLLVIMLDSGIPIQISHFKHKGIVVTEGERVTRGTLLGYCGNSGRSPVPHLHFQVQQAAVPGSHTIGFGLRNYIEVKEGNLRFHHHGIPEVNQRIQSLESDPGIAAMFSDLPGTYQYQWHDKSPEQITCRIDMSGNYVFESDRNSSLSGRVIDDVFHCLSFEGGGHSLLSLFRLALGRVPCSGLEGLSWDDQVSARAYAKPLARYGLEVAAPFTGYRALETRSMFSSVSDQQIELETKVDSPFGLAPEFVKLTFTKGRGITMIATDQMEASQID